MSEKELWEELKLSDDVRVQLMQGAVVSKITSWDRLQGSCQGGFG